MEHLLPHEIIERELEMQEAAEIEERREEELRVAEVEVAEVVSSRDGYSKPPKSDVQCKNRIDTLKKKYKVEKAKSDSSWPFFDRLDFLLAPVQKLLGNSGGAAGNFGSSNPSNRSTAPMAPRVNFPQRTRTAFPSIGMKRRLPSPPQASASSESSDGFPPEPLAEAVNGKRQRLEESANGADSSDRAQGLRDLAQAIRRLGETYERVVSSKGEHELRMERSRLDAARELEDQRVQFFLKMEMEISKANNGAPLAVPLAAAAMVGNSASTAEDGDSPATADGNGPRRASMATDVRASSNHHVRYRVKDDRHHHASRRPSYQYNQNNVGAADAGGIGSGSDSGGTSPVIGDLAAAAAHPWRPGKLVRQLLATTTLLPRCSDELVRQPLHTTVHETVGSPSPRSYWRLSGNFLLEEKGDAAYITDEATVTAAGFLAAPSRVFPASIAAVEAKQQQRRTQTPCC
ncbi:unnamed protein product [Triticum turgidum subsp. durum]|uniref:Myb/SANT-like DNA-binding domain-containing protein n=1 Tax=Triticum turgidum subsp. durum TaxID=4567 RepID=A0A9R0Y003_TRITD|nr:unnamed protein product [Triticum turgidum subsp. durum]